jgi:hypothetical protein
MRRGSAWPTPTALAAARRADRCGRMAGIDGRAFNPRERGGGGEGNGSTLPARKRACRARRATSPRGVQPVGANESAVRVGQVLEDLDQKLDGGEDLRVGVEIVAVGSAIDNGVRAPWSTSSFWSETGGRTMNCASAWRVSVEPAGMRIDASTEKPLWVQLTMFELTKGCNPHYEGSLIAVASQQIGHLFVAPSCVHREPAFCWRTQSQYGFPGGLL